jgi:hypothetical protein
LATDVVSDSGSIDAGATLDIRPPSGVKWFIQLITVNPTAEGAECLWVKSDGAEPETLTENAVIAKGTSGFNVEFQLTLNNLNFVRIKNLDSTTAIKYGYSGVTL